MFLHHVLLVLHANNNVGVSLHLLGRHDEALTAFEVTLAIRRTRLGAGHAATANALNKVGQCLVDVGRYRDAEKLLLEAYQLLKPRRKEEAQQWGTALEQLARLYRATGREELAGRYAAMRDE